ncbi:MAG TPA: hypothetical protein VK654_01520 [Nitrospirota bacterium]|nr:hypothetical protein [Nitrospirota bacterium]
MLQKDNIAVRRRWPRWVALMLALVAGAALAFAMERSGTMPSFASSHQSSVQKPPIDLVVPRETATATFAMG